MNYNDVEILLKFAHSLSWFKLYQMNGKVAVEGMFEFPGFHKSQVEEFVAEFNRRIRPVLQAYREELDAKIREAVAEAPAGREGR